MPRRVSFLRVSALLVCLFHFLALHGRTHVCSSPLRDLPPGTMASKCCPWPTRRMHADDRDDPLGGGKKKGRKTGEPCRTRLESRPTWGDAGRTRKNRRKELGVMVMSCWRATVATVRTSPPPLSLGMFLSVSTGATDPEHSVLCPYYLGSSAGKELR